MKDEFTRVSLDAIVPRNDGQARKTFVGIKQLSESIRQHGLLENLIVEKIGPRYVLQAGERRYRALLELQKIKILPAGWEDWMVPVLVKQLTGLESEWIGIVENEIRCDVYSWETGEKLLNLSRVASLEDIAARVSKPRAWVKRCIEIHQKLHPDAVTQIIKIGLDQFTSTDFWALTRLLDDIGKPDGPKQLALIERMRLLKWADDAYPKKNNGPNGRTTPRAIERRVRTLTEQHIPQRYGPIVRRIQAWLTGKIEKLDLEDIE